MKKILSILSFAAVAFAIGAPHQNAKAEPVAVVELYTSQGCSSCPPADAFLGELSMRSDVLALAFHVDYWDYIGWKDPHAKHEHTQRQRQYASSFNLRFIYTPQMVVNGSFETSGNKRRDVIASIENQLKAASTFKMSFEAGKLYLDGPDMGVGSAIYRVSYIGEQETEIRRGENRGRTLSYYNIVTGLEEIGAWFGGPLAFDIDPSSLDANMKHAFFVQRSDNMKIIAASRMQHK